MIKSAPTTRNLCPQCYAELTSADYEHQACTQCGAPIEGETMATTLQVFKEEPYRHRIVRARRVRDATGAYCLDCQRVIADDCQVYWHWRKSQKMHEQGSGHRTIMYRLG